MNDQDKAARIIETLQLLSRRENRPLRDDHYQSYRAANNVDLPEVKDIYALFGSFQVALQTAGIEVKDPQTIASDRRTKAIFDLQTVFEQLPGSDLEQEEYEMFRKNTPPTMALLAAEEIVALYTSWEQALRLAGLLPTV